MSDNFKNVAKRDTSQGGEVLSEHRLIADAGSNNTWVISLLGLGEGAEAGYPVIGLRKINSAGAGTGVEILIDLKSLGDLSVTGQVKFRELRWKDASTCVTYRAAFLMSAPEAVV